MNWPWPVTSPLPFMRSSHGPVVHPISPERETWACTGRQISTTGDGGVFAACHQSLPATGPGRKRMPSSARKFRNASRIPFCTDQLEKARSAWTTESRIGWRS
jgi:hypothetical protein